MDLIEFPRIQQCNLVLTDLLIDFTIKLINLLIYLSLQETTLYTNHDLLFIAISNKPSSLVVSTPLLAIETCRNTYSSKVKLDWSARQITRQCLTVQDPARFSTNLLWMAYFHVLSKLVMKLSSRILQNCMQK